MNEVRKKKYNPAIISVSLCEIFAQKSTNQDKVKKNLWQWQVQIKKSLSL